MSVPEYDLFSGIFDKNAMWLEAVEGLGNAFERMKDLASEAPGSYFVFCTQNPSGHGFRRYLGASEKPREPIRQRFRVSFPDPWFRLIPVGPEDRFPLLREIP